MATWPSVPKRLICPDENMAFQPSKTLICPDEASNIYRDNQGLTGPPVALALSLIREFT